MPATKWPDGRWKRLIGEHSAKTPRERWYGVVVGDTWGNQKYGVTWAFVL